MTKDEMVGQCHQSYQHEFDPTSGGSGRQEGLPCSGPGVHEESDMTKQQQQKLLQLLDILFQGEGSDFMCSKYIMKYNKCLHIYDQNVLFFVGVGKWVFTTV